MHFAITMLKLRVNIVWGVMAQPVMGLLKGQSRWEGP